MKGYYRPGALCVLESEPLQCFRSCQKLRGVSVEGIMGFVAFLSDFDILVDLKSSLTCLEDSEL